MAIQYAQAPFRILGTLSPRLNARLALKLFTTPRRWKTPAWEQEIAGAAVKVELKTGHAGLSWGQGPPVLLVHGWEGRVTQLGRFVAPLVARGFRVIGFSAPGHGEQVGEPLNVLDYAHFLKRVAGEYGPLYAVIAHSMGASAVGFAASLHLSAQRAVLISPPQSVMGVVERFEDLLALNWQTRRIFRYRLETEVFKTPLVDLDLTRRRLRFLPQTLLLATDDDKDVPVADAERVAMHWPDARLQVTRQAGGHRKLLRDDRVIDAAVGFITGESWSRRPTEAPAASSTMIGLTA
jgi:pimeloyl-ACP methyl ester carboxylesterase